MSTELTNYQPGAVAVFDMAQPPEQVLAQAKHVATLLRDVIAQTEAEVSIAGRKHLKIEGWLTLGSFYGITPRTILTNYVEVGGAHGYEATAQAVHVATGTVLSQQDGMCLNDEPNWFTRPKYEWKDGKKTKVGDEPVTHQQRRSMAATRAQSKAMSIPLRWIAVLAGYQATPAEEMHGNEYGEQRAPVQQPQRKAAGPGVISEPQRKRLYAMSKKAGLSNDEMHALLAEFGYDSSNAINKSNYEAICSRVEAGDKASGETKPASGETKPPAGDTGAWRSHFTAAQQPAIVAWLKGEHQRTGDAAIDEFFARWQDDYSDALETAEHWLARNKQGMLGV
jgi:hypothetical protein